MPSWPLKYKCFLLNRPRKLFFKGFIRAFGTWLFPQALCILGYQAKFLLFCKADSIWARRWEIYFSNWKIGTKVADWCLLDYKLAFTHCSGEVLDYKIPTTCLVFVGKCLRGLHPLSFIAQNLDKLETRIFVFHPKFLKLWVSSDYLLTTTRGACAAGLLENTLKFHTAPFRWFLPVFTCLICCFIWKH